MQYQLDECPDFTGVTMEETIIANAPEAPWQHMFYDEVKESLSFYGSISKLTSSAVTVPEGDIAVARGNNVFFADDSSIEIFGQILQGREAIAHIVTMCNPFNRYGFGESQAGGSDHGEEFSAKLFGQGKAVEEVIIFYPYPFA